MMEQRQISTAFSDLVLAISAIYGFKELSESPIAEFQFGKWWFMLECLAATLGVFRFGRFIPKLQESITKYHTNFSWLCRSIGMPCLGSEISKKYRQKAWSQGFLLSAVATFIAASLKSQHKDRFLEVVNFATVATMLWFGSVEGNPSILYAGILFIVSSIVGSEGTVPYIKIPRVDLLHYILVLVNYFLLDGFLVKV